MVRKWPRVTSLILALMPVSILVFIVVSLVLGSLLAIDEMGLETLFSTEFSGTYTTGERIYGLIPAIWGTVLTVVIAIAIALPVSLAMAVFSSEFPLGILGRAMRGILGVLSSIPPIVYALMAWGFVELFMITKFTGAGLEEIPPPGMTWWNLGTLPTQTAGGNSTLLGGILLALLVIPFMAPLIDDAIRNVPQSLKEGSLALGADRWRTLMKVTLPLAMSGIISATALGALKAIGDVLIVSWVIGYESGLPNPLWDILEKTATLTSTGAGLGGGFEYSGGCSGLECSVAYFTGLLLLIMALAILAVEAFLQRRFKRRFSS